MSCNINFCLLSFADGAFKGTVRRSNSFDLAIIVAAGESSKTDTREFIEQQRQLLDELKIYDEDVVKNDDDGRTDSASSDMSESTEQQHQLLDESKRSDEGVVTTGFLLRFEIARTTEAIAGTKNGGGAAILAHNAKLE